MGRGLSSEQRQVLTVLEENGWPMTLWNLKLALGGEKRDGLLGSFIVGTKLSLDRTLRRLQHRGLVVHISREWTAVSTPELRQRALSSADSECRHSQRELEVAERRRDKALSLYRQILEAMVQAEEEHQELEQLCK